MLARGEEFSGQILHAGKQWKRDLDLGFDLLINAEEQLDGGCRRTVFDICFNNATTELDHHECDSTDAHSCSHCNIMEPPTCCDIHNPSVFSSYESCVPKASHMTQCSHLPKYMKDKYDYALENSLLDWCGKKTAAVYGWACLGNDGLVIMSDSMLSCIVDCAHHHKIETYEDLKRETGWIDSKLYGDEVLSLIQRHACPLSSVFISTPLSCGTSSTITTPTCPSKCSACSQEGHNGECNSSLQ
ncbi:hypothetical protein EDC04DRAFT_2580611 [Pisolithus marmoratus]|nr:hypothetical protein EDC04DRAFT_2580611 [Pisolithus marmoratus]